MLFTDAPLSASTLSSRLQRYRFFDKKVSPLGVARNASQAAQTVEQQKLDLQKARESTEPINKATIKNRRIASLDVSKHPDPASILDKIYRHPAIHAHFSALWRDVLSSKPRPPLSTQIKLLKSNIDATRHKNPDLLSAIYACLRVNLADKHFLSSFQLLDLVSGRIPTQTLPHIVGLSSMAALSYFTWASFPLIAVIYPLFYGGFIATILSAATPKQPLVKFDPVHTTWWYRLKNKQRLHMANMIMTEFHESGTTTVSNYHRRSAHEEPSRAVHRQSVNELEQRHMMSCNSSTSAELMYADYWSPSYQRWQNVEWREPDQDPAEMIEQAKQREDNKRANSML